MLDTTWALQQAARLTTVKEFPRLQEAIDAVAEDFIDLTAGLDATEAERRVRTLVQEIRRTWTEWSGESDLLRLYRERWPEPRDVKSEDNEAKNYGARPAIQCRQCNDTGVFRPGGRESKEPYQWCECWMGINLHFDIPDWLEILNRPPRVKLRRTTEAEPTNPDYRPITQADIDRAVAENRDKQARQELEP